MNQNNYNYVKFCKIGESCRGARPCAPTGVVDLWQVQCNEQRGLFLLAYLTDRVNYKVDRDIRAILSRVAERQGRTESAQVEQMIL